MYTLRHQKKQKQTRRSTGTKICKGCLGLIKNIYINLLNKNKSKKLYWS